jgi:hypothetical protein
MRLLHLILLLLLGLSVQFCGKKEEKKKDDSSLAARGDCSKNSSDRDDDDDADDDDDDDDADKGDDEDEDEDEDENDGSSSKSKSDKSTSKKTSKKPLKKTSTAEKNADSPRLSLKEKSGAADAPCTRKDDDDDDEDYETKIVTVTVIATATGTSSASATSTNTSTATGTSTATSTSTSTATSTDKGKVLGLISNEVTDLPTFSVKSVYAMVDDASGKPELSFYLLPDEVRDCDKDMEVDLAKSILVSFSTVVGQVPVDTVDANGFPKQDTNKTTGEADNKSGMSISLDGMAGDHKGSLNFTAGKRPAKVGDAFEAAVDLQFEGGKKYKATLKGKVVESILDPRCE